MVSGKPLSQFMLRCVTPTSPTTFRAACWASTAAIIAAAVVLPTDPVTPMMNGLRHRSTQDAQKDKYRMTTRRSEEHTSELQSLMRISYAVFCLKKKKDKIQLKSLKHTTYNMNTKTNT